MTRWPILTGEYPAWPDGNAADNGPIVQRLRITSVAAAWPLSIAR
jgi:hypothetical protein